MENNEKLLQQLKEALVAIKKLKGDLNAEREKSFEPIAIIGMAMRFPGDITNGKRYWEVLETGFDAITDIPNNRFNAKELYTENPDESGKITLKQGGFLNDIDKFDGSFFDISYTELENLDPQQRLGLEVTYEALENAGLDVKKLVDSDTSVFAGITNIDYQSKSFRTGDFTSINHYSYSGQALCANSGRISYLLGLQGPSVTIDTACSSSLVATDMAVKSLRNNDSSLSIVTACNLILDPELTIYFSHLNALSKNSRCKSFSNEGNGFVRSEGCATIILKRLSDAQRDGDNVLAIIKGTAVNQDGKSNGFTAPSVSAQKKLLITALKNARLNPSQIDYIEAHGTGTKIGDPIEMDAISAVFKSGRYKENPLLIGSVKTNFGHTEAVAGLAGLIKVILALENKKIPKNLHFETPNELIDWQNLPFKVPTTNTNWDNAEKNAGVSGFGVTGTNAHVILSNPPLVEREKPALRNDFYALPLSAKSEESLKGLVNRYIDFLKVSTNSLEEICAMAALKRTHWEYRIVFVAKTKAELIEQLSDFTQVEYEPKNVFDEDAEPNIVFVFPGQGAQWIGMGKQLFESELIFKESIIASRDAFKKWVDWDLIEELNKGEGSSRFDEIDVIQPILVAIEIALADLWKSKGIVPDAVVGHSMGEVAAAYVAGILTLNESAQIICLRSKLMKRQSGKGEMGVTDLTENEAKEHINGFENILSIAVINSPNSTVLSGESEALNKVFEKLEAEGRFCKKVKVDVASHSPQMDPIKDELGSNLNQLEPKDSEINFYSTALSSLTKGSSLKSDYWVKNLRNPVQFGASIREILSGGEAIFIEMSPHPVLINAIQENISIAEKKGKGIASFYREKDELISFMQNFGNLHSSGYNVDWTNVYPSIGDFIQLPNYAWIKERFWYDKKHNSKKNVEENIPEPTNCLFTTKWEDLDLPEVENKEKRILIVDNQQEIIKLIEAEFSKNQIIKWNGTDDLSVLLDGVEIDLFMHTGSLGVFNAGYTAMELQEQIEKSCFTAIEAIKYFSKKGLKPAIYFITNGAQSSAKNEDIINLNGSTLFGLGRTIDNEMEEFQHKRIDIPFQSSVEDIKLLYKLINGDFFQKEFVIRDGKARTPILSRFEGSLPNFNNHFSGDGAYLITGGTSGLGLLYAKWMVQSGARKIALVSRSGEKPETIAAMDEMKQVGANVRVYKADISDINAVKTLLGDIERDLGKWVGVVHGAGVLDDASLLEMTPKQFNNVMDAKVKGAWNLHKASIGKNLDTFTLFSSGASVLGTPGQGNYVAANMFLDQLAHLRFNNKMVAKSINWGNIGEVGLAAAQENRGNRLVELGIGAFLPKNLPNYFSALLVTEGPQWMLMDIDFEKWAKGNPSVLKNYFYKKVLNINSETSNESPKTSIYKAATFAQAKRQINEFVKLTVSGITKVPVSKIKEDATFKSMGIDSLMAIQLKNKLQAEFNVTLAVSSIWAHPTVDKYGDFIIGELKLKEQYEPTIKVESKMEAEIETQELSFEELMKQLEEKTK